ncbi:enoyl-CoA hydratase/isomerase family protein [Mesorhizobium sp. KR9-304]|uniref:enoyl-CoA hydratase/isomerase family protein n=1 Tax=Mesorhizobium sp. KR9-304 TaxID=3156614 RepID=UPI0032B38165
MSSDILIEIGADRVAHLVLNRPNKHNAITPDMAAAIRDGLQRLAADENVRVVVVRGAGEKAFCAGTDLNSLDGFGSPWGFRNAINYAREFDAFEKPIVCALKGWVYGGGFEIALNCDIRVSSPSARFAAPEVKHGWLGAGGFSQRLTRLVGYGHASRILFTGQPIDAADAHRIGVVEILVEEGAELETALALAKDMAANSEIALMTNKAGIRAAMEGGLTNGLAMERELMGFAMAMGAYGEGPSKFRARKE